MATTMSPTTLKNMVVQLETAPTASFTLKVRKNLSNTALTVLIPAGNTSGSNLSNTVSFAGGDIFNIKTTGTLTSALRISFIQVPN
jgi:hypothetical protein